MKCEYGADIIVTKKKQKSLLDRIFIILFWIEIVTHEIIIKYCESNRINLCFYAGLLVTETAKTNQIII